MCLCWHYPSYPGKLSKGATGRLCFPICRKSGSLEQDADVVLFLSRPKGEEDDDTPSGIVEVTVAKNRNGPVGMEKLGFEPRYTMFMDLTENFPPM